PYCDFNSHEVRGEIDEAAYVDALLRDLEQDLPRVWGRTVHTVFFGGGTPSLFAPASIDRLLSGIRARVPLDPRAEITLEANPGTVELERFRGYREAGINRLSIGIQSFEPEKLQALGRIHGRDESLAAARAARDAGFNNFNLDLMFGLPGQTVDQAKADLTTALEQTPTHLSLYQLTIEANTLFNARPPVLPDEDTIWEMQTALQAMTADAGFGQYEVSAYAHPERESRHNINYWNFGDYLGIGAGAHGKLSDARSVTRLWKHKHPKSYLQTAGTPASVDGEQTLDRHDLVVEFMLNALRLTHGFPVHLFQDHTGLPITAAGEALALAEQRGLIERDAHTIRPTQLGRTHLNNLLELFLEPETERVVR
ncbi:MAG: radical SAM family heme chaperone HemW, partial [Acidiferrobacteraceae bacterium]